MSITAIARINYYTKLHQVDIELDKDIVPLLIRLRTRYTLFSYANALKLRSKYSKRLYEMLSQFKKTGVLHISLDELKLRLGLLNEETGQDKYTDFASLKRSVLDVCEKEINNLDDIKFSYRAAKSGRKYTQLTFHIGNPGQKGIESVSPPAVPQEGLEIRALPQPRQKLTPDEFKTKELLVDDLKYTDIQTAHKLLRQIGLQRLSELTWKLKAQIKKDQAIVPQHFFKALLGKLNKGGLLTVEEYVSGTPSRLAGYLHRDMKFNVSELIQLLERISETDLSQVIADFEKDIQRGYTERSKSELYKRIHDIISKKLPQNTR